VERSTLVSKLEQYVSLVTTCEGKALHGGHPDRSALWRHLAEEYRFLASIERRHQTPRGVFAEIHGLIAEDGGLMPAAELL
jgi:hypothetical protein